MQKALDDTITQARKSPEIATHPIQPAGKILGIILFLGLVQGLLYTFLVPPWMNHDEPGHFEFAWQIANFDHWPEDGEFDPEMRLSLARSLDSYNWYMDFKVKPDLSGNLPVYIGIPQHNNHPLYHFLASLLLRLIPGADLVSQLLVLRLFSSLLFVLTLWAAWQALGEILPAGHPLQWMTVLFMALLPGLANAMIAVNSDAGAILVFTLFVWASLRLMRYGISLPRLAGLLLSLALCYWTKNTAWPAILLAVPVLLFALLGLRWRWLPWALSGIAGLVLILLTLGWGDASLWYRSSGQPEPTRQQSAQAVLGDHVFRMNFDDSEKNARLIQIINTPELRPLRGRQVTLGAWMWADRPVRVRIPTLQMEIDRWRAERPSSKYVDLTTAPVFYSHTFTFASDTQRALAGLWPLPNIEAQDDPVTIYLDGIVLAEGAFNGIPEFDNDDGLAGQWDDLPFTNIIRNASAEQGWYYFVLQLPEWDALSRFSPTSMQVFIASLQDWDGSQPYYRAAGLQLFQTFWSYGPGGRVPLIAGEQIYPVLQGLMILSLLGCLLLVIWKRHHIPWPILFFLAITIFLVWSITLMRGGMELLVLSRILPWARYAMPAILPVALFLVAGWWQLFDLLAKRLGIVPQQVKSFFIAFLLGLNFFSLLSTAEFFNPGEGREYFVFFISLILAFVLILQWLSRGGHTREQAGNNLFTED